MWADIQSNSSWPKDIHHDQNQFCANLSHGCIVQIGSSYMHIILCKLGFGWSGEFHVTIWECPMLSHPSKSNPKFHRLLRQHNARLAPEKKKKNNNFWHSHCVVYSAYSFVSRWNQGSKITTKCQRKEIDMKITKIVFKSDEIFDIFCSFFRLNWKELLLQPRSSLKWQQLKHFASSPIIVTARECINFVKCPIVCFSVFLCFNAVYTY